MLFAVTYLFSRVVPGVFMAAYAAIGQGFLYGAFVFVFWFGICWALFELPRPRTSWAKFFDDFTHIFVVRSFPLVLCIRYFHLYFGVLGAVLAGVCLWVMELAQIRLYRRMVEMSDREQ
jgi:hypothetical protein